jgi:hypothetical protein
MRYGSLGMLALGGLDLSGIWYSLPEEMSTMLKNHYQTEVQNGDKKIRIHALRTGFVQVKNAHLQLR